MGAGALLYFGDRDTSNAKLKQLRTLSGLIQGPWVPGFFLVRYPGHPQVYPTKLCRTVCPLPIGLDMAWAFGEVLELFSSHQCSA